MSKEHNTKYSIDSLIKEAKSLIQSSSNKQTIHEFLKLGSKSEVNRLFTDSPLRDEWYKLLVKLIEQSGFHTGQLFLQRAPEYSSKPLFQTIKGHNLSSVSYREAWRHIQQIGLSLIHLTRKIEHPVIGILSKNSLEGALVDLTCLSYGFRVVPIPANSSIQHLEYIIQHAGITDIFIGDCPSYSLFESILRKISINSITTLPNFSLQNSTYQSWKSFLNLGNSIDDSLLSERLTRGDMEGIATIMYTSGTTANPKGIIFSQTNLISKRFARALAIPSLNQNDVFLSFLPLYHTFGRFLELMGSVFHGATYTFAETTMFQSLLIGFSIAKPTVFISIPKRWIQIYDQIRQHLSLDDVKPEQVEQSIAKLTGGKLRLGLSAAGFLDPDIFRFYHQFGIKLLSGYGMTEATGGITMTPENDYVENSVGRALPGVTLSLGEDDELLLKGSYISTGYYGESITPTMQNGWFHTGDIFKEKNGHYFIIDRKKEIYKNSRGQTISPQKIENMFQDFEAIKSVFLVGDMKEYNTVLIYPDTQSESLKIIKNEPEEIREFFGSLVQSVNNFLSPYERIINFAIIPRDFSTDHGELTSKSTYKRKQILRNFAEIIQPMYEKHYIPIIHGEHEIRIPKWLMREKGVISTDLSWDGAILKAGNHHLTLKGINDSLLIQLGDFEYTNLSTTIHLDDILKSPELWMGNHSLIQFIGDIAFRITLDESSASVQVNCDHLPYGKHPATDILVEDIKFALRKSEYSLKSLHQAGIILLQDDQYRALIALNYLYQTIENRNSDLKSLAIKLLMRAQAHPSPKIRVKSLEYLLPHISGELFIELVFKTFKSIQSVEIIEDMVLQTNFLEKTHFNAIIEHLKILRLNPNDISTTPSSLIDILLRTITHYGILHPTSYIWVRAELTFWDQKVYPSSIQKSAKNALQVLTKGFQSWLGNNHQLAIDRETGEEYTWEDVITFENNVENPHRILLHDVFKKTPILREAVFLFSKRRLIQLDDILHRGMWISLLAKNHGKSIYRVLVQTRDGDSFNFVININDSLDPAFIQDEIQLLIMMGSSMHGDKLVEDFGGYWPKFNLYSEEYISGENLQQYLERNESEIAEKKAIDRWQMRWLHFIWNGLKAYLEFYKRSDHTLSIANPTPTNLIVPEFDYSIGTRLISISDRKEVHHFYEVLLDLYEIFILKTESSFLGLQRMADWELVFTTLMEVFKIKKGITLLNEIKSEINSNTQLKRRASKLGLTIKRIEVFIDEVQPNGVLTKPVVFASLRYERWLNLNENATIKARGTILQELYKEYRLKTLLKEYPETRIRFFKMTCFKDASPELTQTLEALQKQLRSREIKLPELDSHLQVVVNSNKITEDERYFLTRLLFEHIDASQEGELISWEIGDKGRLDLISMAEDKHGDTYRIRPPFHPKEIANFHTILTQSHLTSRFQQNHDFLFIVNQNNHLVGGIYWKEVNSQTAYIEKIVIKPPYRNRLLSKQLLNELFSRLQNRRFDYVTVGFFQAGLFYKYDFKIDKKFGGLVKSLSFENE